tara:strand:- start:38 stop:424 length:387 start_codon:yes stop_codon:yes gene_type:complete
VSTLLTQGKIEHDWGYELVWASSKNYCGKILVFEKRGATTPMWIHKERRKSWFVNSGKFKLKFIDVKTGLERIVDLDEGRNVDISEMSPHQLECIHPNSVIFEVGTPHWDTDDFKLSPNSSQKLPEGQ